MSTTQMNISDDLVAQRAYSQRQADEGFDFGLTVADAFVRGIRDIGYRDTGRALDEELDNALQAEATKILVTFGFEGTDSSAKPTAVAVVDNGHGMDPEMIRLAAIWGGTHRENDRHGLGRYGYGLPSSCVSQGQRFTIYSIVDGGALHAVTLDLEEISAGKYAGEERPNRYAGSPRREDTGVADRRNRGPLWHRRLLTWNGGSDREARSSDVDNEVSA